MELRFILVSHCNFDCYFCLNEYYGNKNANYSLTDTDYQCISNLCLDNFGISKITLSGGEPTLRKDLKKIVSKLYHQNIDITLVSNGVLINRHLESLKFLDELHVSFHSFNEHDWARITRSKPKYMHIVKENIILTRKTYPKLKIKLNVVSEEGNKGDKEIEQYLNFARKNNLGINLFRDGSRKFFNPDDPEESLNRSDWWDISDYDPKLINVQPRKKMWKIDNVLLAFSSTSTDSQSWDSIWVTPAGDIYCDIFQRSPVLNIKSILYENDLGSLKKAIESFVSEAKLNSKLQNQLAKEKKSKIRDRLDDLLTQRKMLDSTVKPKRIKKNTYGGTF